MKITLQELLPANISDEAAMHIVNFIRALSLAIESIYFDRLMVKNGFLSCAEELETPIRFNAEDNPF